MRPIDINAICERIAVRQPYFAYRSLALDDDATLHGTFVPEQPLEYERSPITAAEVGRHLAILGACAALAGADTTKIYYLATEAHYTRRRNPTHGASGQTLHATAKVVSKGRRDLVVDATVSDGLPFAELNVRYEALPEPLFARFFALFRSPTPRRRAASPYASLLPLHFDYPSAKSISAHSAALSPDLCAGHFPDYPAWPVALIMHCLGRVAGRLLHHIAGQPLGYTVMRAHVSADTLVFATQPLSFHATLNAADACPPVYAFTCHATYQDKLVARLETSFQVHDQPAALHRI